MAKILAAIKKHGGILPAIAMTLAVASVGQACFFWYHQPDVPASLTDGKDN